MADQRVNSRVNLGNIGSTGLRHSGGHIFEEWLRMLEGDRAERVYREMSDNCAIIGAFLYAVKSLIRQVEWRIEPADDSDEAKVEAEFIESCMHDMSHTWDDLLVEALSELIYGHSYHELVYKVRRGQLEKDGQYRSKHDDGKIGWRKIPIRSQDTLENWEFEEDGGIEGVWQQDPYRIGGHSVFIPIEKALLFRTETSKGNPEGRSCLRASVRSWWMLKRIQEHESIGIERDLSGYPVIFVPLRMLMVSATAEEKALVLVMQKMVQEIKRDEREGAVFPHPKDTDGNPTGFDIKLLSTGGNRQIDTNSVIVRYESRIAMTVLADFIMLGHEKVGSFSLASSKTALFAVALGAIMEGVAEVFNRFAIPRLQRINNAPPEMDPTLVYGDIEKPDLVELGEFLETLATTGILNSGTALERKMLEVGNLPQNEEEEFGDEMVPLPELPEDTEELEAPEAEPPASP